MKFVAGLLSISMTFTSAFSFAAGPQCTDVNIGKYMKVGAPEDAAPDKIYRFADMRQDIIKNIGDAHKTRCLNDAYQSGLEQEAQYWGKRITEAGCSVDEDGDVPDDCSIADEVRASNEFLYNLENDSNRDIRHAIQISRQIAAEERQAAAQPAPTCSAQPQSVALTRDELHKASCCGSPGEKAGGAVGTNEPNISYQECLGKIGKNTHSVADTVITCAASVVKGAITAIWEAIKGLWHLPAMIGQVWSLMTNASARNAFFNKMKDYVMAKKQAVFSCYNAHEVAQEACRDVGALLTMCAAPESAVALIGILAKPLTVLARARAIEGVVATTARGRAMVARMGRGKAAADRAVALARGTAARGRAAGRAVAERGRAVAARAPRTAAFVRGANEFRRKFGRPFSAPVERMALAASRSGVYKRMLQRAVRAEEQARGRATAAGGTVGRTFGGATRVAPVAEATSGAGATTGGTTGSTTGGVRVSLNEPLPTTPLTTGARLGETPRAVSAKFSYTQTDPMANLPPLGRGARLGTKPEGSISYSETIPAKPAPPTPDVNMNVRIGKVEPRPASATRPELRFESTSPRAKADVTKVKENIGRLAEPENPAAVRDPSTPEGAAYRAQARETHAEISRLRDEKVISPEEARAAHARVNETVSDVTGENWRGRRGDRGRGERRDGDEKIADPGKPAEGPKTVETELPRPVSTAEANGQQLVRSQRTAPAPAPARPVRTERELTDSRNYLDRFSTKIERLSSDPTRNEREALRAFQSSRPDKIHAEADRLHSQVDDLIAANRISAKQASSYHDNISLGESYATKSPTVREWKPATASTDAPVPVDPVRRLNQPVNEPDGAAPVPDESSDFVYPPETPAPAPAASSSSAQPATAAARESAPAPATTVTTPLKPSERALADRFQKTLEDVAPKVNPASPAKDSYTGLGYWRRWVGTKDLPDQGWKLHVSTTPEKAEKIAKLLLPELRKRGIGHSIVSDFGKYLARPSTDAQFGKFITIYPKNAAEARQVAALAEKMMKRAGFKDGDFPTPPGDQIAGVGVYARYGRLTGGYLRDPATGAKIPDSYDMIRTPDGKLVPDTSRGEPFAFAGQLIEPKGRNLLQRTRDRLRRSSGNTPEAVTPAPVAPVRSGPIPARGGAVVPAVRLLAPTPTPVPTKPSSGRSTSSNPAPKPRPVVAPASTSSSNLPKDTMMDVANDAADAAASEAADSAAFAPTN